MTQQPADPSGILGQLPKKTPVWAVGIVSILVSLSTCVVAIYFVGQDEIKQFLEWSEQHHESKDTKLLTEYTDTLKTVLSLVDTNSAQITELSKTLGAAQQQNAILSDRVAALEKFLQLANGNLELCEAKLKSCKRE